MRAFVIDHDGDAVTTEVRDVDPAEFLVEGDVTVDVEWSCCNYKDAMSAAPRSRVARRSPLIGGVDAAGTVTESDDPSMPVGTRVIAQGHGFGTSHHGGFAERLACPGSWLVALPDGLDTRTAMLFGTAGYTAMASVLALEHAGLRRGDGEVLVTGASGGVGSVSVALLAARGYEVVALTGPTSTPTSRLSGLPASSAATIWRTDPIGSSARSSSPPPWTASGARRSRASCAACAGAEPWRRAGSWVVSPSRRPSTPSSRGTYR